MAAHTMDQKRCAAAHAAVSAHASPDFASRARELPTMLRRNGIGQTLAFHMPMGDAPSAVAKRAVREGLDAWVGTNVLGPTWRNGLRGEQNSLLAQLMKKDRDVWWHAQREAEAYAIWLKRWAEALIPSDSATPRGAHTNDTPSA